MAHPFPALFLARHCKTAWNLDGRIQGSIDMPLCAEGLAEAAAMIPRLAPYRFSRIVASPYKRALQTARIYAEGLEVPLETHRGLRELDHGHWEGQSIEKLMQMHASGYRDWVKDATRIAIPQGSETVAEAQTRVVQAVIDIAAGDTGARILVVLHKHIRALLNCCLNGLDLRSFGNCIEERIGPQQISEVQMGRLLAARRQSDLRCLE